MIINFVITKDLKSRIFCDIFRRVLNHNTGVEVVISEEPIDNADIYHYHRVHLVDGNLARPAVMTVHHDPFDLDPWLNPEQFYRHYRVADTVVCLNTVQKKELARLGMTNTVVIPHGYDSRLFRRKRPVKQFDPSHKIKLGTISKRYGRRFKGEVLLYEILQRVDPERFEFLFVGDGRIEDAEYARNLGFEAQSFDFMPYRLFPKLYSSMDFLLMISNYEGGPANLPEAIASGTPLISTRIGMAVDLVRNYENGVFVSGNADKDASLFEKISKNEDALYTKLMTGANALNTAITWEANIDMHLDLYRTLVSAKSSVA